MQRRRVLAAAGVVLGASGGCLQRFRIDEANGPPSVDAPTVELGPGEETTVTVEAKNVGWMSIPLQVPADDSGQSRPVVEIDGENLTPSPTGVEESMPPDWHWSPPRATVTYEALIRVSDDVSPGTYDYPVNVSKDSTRESEPISVRVMA